MNLNDLRMSLKAALDNMWARIDARITAIEQGGGGGGVTGVKGNAESSYRQGNVNLTPANIGAVNKAGDTMTGDLTLSANGGTVTLHPYWDSTDGQSLGFYINAKNTEALNAIFLPLIADNANARNIHLLSDLEPVKISQGGTGATTAAGARANLGIHYTDVFIPVNGTDCVTDLSAANSQIISVLHVNPVSSVCTIKGAQTYNGVWYIFCDAVQVNTAQVRIFYVTV